MTLGTLRAVGMVVTGGWIFGNLYISKSHSHLPSGVVMNLMTTVSCVARLITNVKHKVG